MTHWQNLWAFKTSNFAVTLDCTGEESPDLSWDESGETAAKIESGEWGNFCFRVRVTCHGDEVGCDYLGNSVYADPREFRDHIGIKAKGRADGRDYGSYFTDMVGEAVSEARKNMAALRAIRLREVA